MSNFVYKFCMLNCGILIYIYTGKQIEWRILFGKGNGKAKEPYNPTRVQQNLDKDDIVHDKSNYSFDISTWLEGLLAAPCLDLGVKIKYYICEYFLFTSENDRVCNIW